MPSKWVLGYVHHCARLEFGDFWESSPNFFSARMGVVPLLGAEGPQKLVTACRRRAVYEKFQKFEIF